MHQRHQYLLGKVWVATAIPIDALKAIDGKPASPRQFFQIAESAQQAGFKRKTYLAMRI